MNRKDYLLGNDNRPEPPFPIGAELIATDNWYNITPRPMRTVKITHIVFMNNKLKNDGKEEWHAGIEGSDEKDNHLIRFEKLKELYKLK